MKADVHRKTCTKKFIAILFTVAETQKCPRWPATDECVNKLWFVHIMEYYSAMQRNEWFPHM
jgi:hypothetical protein